MADQDAASQAEARTGLTLDPGAANVLRLAAHTGAASRHYRPGNPPAEWLEVLNALFAGPGPACAWLRWGARRLGRDMRAFAFGPALIDHPPAPGADGWLTSSVHDQLRRTSEIVAPLESPTGP